MIYPSLEYAPGSLDRQCFCHAERDFPGGSSGVGTASNAVDASRSREGARRSFDSSVAADLITPPAEVDAPPQASPFAGAAPEDHQASREIAGKYHGRNGSIREIGMIRDAWHIACATAQLGTTPRATRVLDEDLVVFRDAEGKPRVLLDRCCHRGAKLSLGKVTDGNLACGYHGWQYDGAGSCVHIPSFTRERRIPPSFTVPSFPCYEQESYVWVWMGKGAPKPERPLPIPGFDRSAWYQGSSLMACNAMLLLENQIDGTHPPFVHPGTHVIDAVVRARGFTEYDVETRMTETGFAWFTPATASAETPMPEIPLGGGVFDLPGRIVVHNKSFRKQDIIIINIVPTGTTSCRRDWLWRRGDGSGVTWWDEEPKIVSEDRHIVESSQPAFERYGHSFERSVEADFTSYLVREVVALAAAGEWETRRKSLPQRRIVRYRG
jgi:nitrite reductase/ring-hydroxylating ferredoxin subunit